MEASSPPRQIFESACAEIARAFEARGFKYVKSGPHMERRSGDWKFRVGFNAGARGTPTQAKMYVTARVLSKPLADWRAPQAVPALRMDDHVGGGQMGNLLSPPEPLEWDLADPARLREEVVSSIVKAVGEIALPYFARFEGKDALIVSLESGQMSQVSVGDGIELLLSLGRRDSAERLGRNFLRSREELIPAYAKALEEIERSGKPPMAHSGYASEVAHLAKFYSLRFS